MHQILIAHRVQFYSVYVCITVIVQPLHRLHATLDLYHVRHGYNFLSTTHQCQLFGLQDRQLLATIL